MTDQPQDRQALQKIDPMPAPARQEPLDLLAMAIQKGADVATIERMMGVRRELMAEAAKAQYFDALSAFQAECPIIMRNKPGHENRYAYAPLETIVAKVTPFLVKHGFSHQEDAKVDEKWVEATVTVTHRGGHSETKSFKVPAASNAGMSPQQKYGAAMTYATRYAFCAAFGIRTADKDTDCSPESDTTAGQKAKTALWNLMLPMSNGDTTWSTAKRWMIDECNLAPDTALAKLEPSGWLELLEKVRARIVEIESMRKENQ